jgi:hypothetical protein
MAAAEVAVAAVCMAAVVVAGEGSRHRVDAEVVLLDAGCNWCRKRRYMRESIWCKVKPRQEGGAFFVCAGHDVHKKPLMMQKGFTEILQ